MRAAALVVWRRPFIKAINLRGVRCCSCVVAHCSQPLPAATVLTAAQPSAGCCLAQATVALRHMAQDCALRCCCLAAVSLCCFGPLLRFFRPLPGRVVVLLPPLLPSPLLLHHPGCACCVRCLPARSCQPLHLCRCSHHHHVSSANRRSDGAPHHCHGCAPHLGLEQLC